MFQLPRFSLDYAATKRAVLRWTWGLDALIAAILAWFNPHFAWPFVGGAFLGYGYLWSLMGFAEMIPGQPASHNKLHSVLSIIRVSFTGLLIALLGQFRLQETCIVFCGFLSYKIVLACEIWRQSRNPASEKHF